MIQLSDATVGTQRLAINNSQQAEFGAATPSAPFTLNGHNILDPSNTALLAQDVAASSSLPRVTGSVFVAALGVTVSYIYGIVGYGSTSGNQNVQVMNGYSNGMDFYNSDVYPHTVTYSAF